MKNIALVDDNESNLFLLEELINEWYEDKDLEYNIDCLVNAEDLLENLEDKDYDIIFLDIMMPGMDGFEVLEKIRNEDLSNQPIVIMVSAIIDSEGCQKSAKDLEADAFIIKPVNFEAVEAMLNKYILNKN